MNGKTVNDKTGVTISPTQLRTQIKEKAKEYVDWLRGNYQQNIPEDKKILRPNYDFIFRDAFRYLNFHPGIMEQAQDMLAGRVDRQYDDVSSGIAIHDYIGHIASSQALCWNVILPMKKHDNFKPLFDVLTSVLAQEGMASDFNFGIETTEVLELNVAEDLGEEGKAATSIDVYLRTSQGRVCTVEFKFTEPDFGRCKLPRDRNGKCDGSYGSPSNVEKNNGFFCYLAAIGRRYWHLGGQYNLINPSRLNRPCPLDIYYQALRNLMVAKKRGQESTDSDVRGILVLVSDWRNKAFWGYGNRLDDFKQYLLDVRGKYIADVFRVSVQDIVRRFSGNLYQYKEYFRVKYGFDVS